MGNISIYEIDSKYVDYLSVFEPHLFQNKQVGQVHERKYIGIVLTINESNYFAPLSSFKRKHAKMRNTVDCIKIKHYAVINLNNMFPVPNGLASYVDISKEPDPKYKSLLLAEYRIIKSLQEKIRINAKTVYEHKCKSANQTALAKRCNDFLRLEEVSKQYVQ